MDKDYHDYYHTDIDYLDAAGKASSSDCTGLISNGTVEPEDIADYNELYQFALPKNTVKNSAEEKENE